MADSKKVKICNGDEKCLSLINICRLYIRSDILFSDIRKISKYNPNKSFNNIEQKK